MIPMRRLRPLRGRLVPAYVDYCQNVSARSMAISIETASLVLGLCIERHAQRVLDLGSGFTSYVLRCTNAEVTSVDDSDHWLTQTAGFLARHHKPTTGLMTWDAWTEDPGGPFDLVVHDFASGDMRNRSMWDAAANLATDGVIVFDDAQNSDHRAEMGRVAAHHDLTLVDVRSITEDQVHRFAAVAVA